MISCLLNIWHIELIVATQTKEKNMTLYVTLFFPTFLFDSSERFSGKVLGDLNPVIKCRTHKMVKHTQTIRRLLRHFVGLALKVLKEF